MLELTEAQRQVVLGEENPTILDPHTHEAYVLVRKTVFDLGFQGSTVRRPGYDP